tara:strand:- start:104 stop:289 length:186 start_codon:yes stop_codon:yes gene_type:complete
MNHPQTVFAIEHMGWQDGDKEPTEKQLVEATEKYETDKAKAKLAVLAKLKITADEAALLLG